MGIGSYRPAMRRLSSRVVLPLLALLLPLSACLPLKPLPSPSSPLPEDRFALEVASEIQKQRAAHGRAFYSWYETLGGLAQEWAGGCAYWGILTHRDLGAVMANPDYGNIYSAMSEVILRVPKSSSAAHAVAVWMGSPSHRAKVLSSSYSGMGVGVDDRGGSWYVVANFGRLE